MKKNIALLVVLVLMVCTGVTMAKPSLHLPEDIKIVTPAEDLPSPNLAFFGKTGKWQGYYEVAGRGVGSRGEVAFAFENIEKEGAYLVFLMDGNARYNVPDISQRETPDTAKFVTKQGKLILSFIVSSRRDAFGTAKFWVENGILHGERRIFSGTTTFKLEPIE